MYLIKQLDCIINVSIYICTGKTKALMVIRGFNKIQLFFSALGELQRSKRSITY